MKRAIFVLSVLLCASSAFAQSYQAPASNPTIVVSNCGTVPSDYPSTQGQRAPDTVDTTGRKCESGTAVISPGTSVIGKVLPVACSQTTSQAFIVVGVANSTGTSITSSTSCINGTIYVNNTSNSAVTLRLQDKSGTPIIWVGGNADFSIPPNSNLPIQLTGLVFTSGITAIAGTNAVLNLFIPTLQ